MKLLTDARLPEEEHEFFQILNLFFPAIYDVKYLMKSCKNLKVKWPQREPGGGVSRAGLHAGGCVCVCVQGGLQEVADQLELKRIGRQHQAGSDSLLTGMAFFRMKEVTERSRTSFECRPRRLKNLLLLLLQLFFEDNIDDAKYCGRLYGLGSGSSQPQNGLSSSGAEETNNKH